MKKRMGFLCCLLLVLSSCGVEATKKEYTPLPWPTEEILLYVSADIHWSGVAGGQESALLSQLSYLDEIISTLLDEAKSGEAAALILCGDLTNGGRAEEHQSLIARLQEAEAQGLSIFVAMGNHDMDYGLSAEELADLYGDFGFAEAASRDEASMSYLAQLTQELWLLSLDTNVYAQRESESAGTVSPETLDWVQACLEQAKEAGALVVPFSHHNLVVHTLDGKGMNYNIDRGAALAELLLDYGVPVYLSGHRHNSFIAPIERDGRKVEELVSDMPAAYPHRYTTVTIQEDATIVCEVPQLDVAGWAKRAGRTENALLQFAQSSGKAEEERLAENAETVAALVTDKPSVQAELERFYIDFYSNYRNRTLWQEGARLRADPALALWQQYGSENIYGRWMPWILQNQCNDSTSQILGPYR